MVPPITTAGPSTEMVVPAIVKAEGFGVNTWPATVSTPLEGLSDRLEREMVLLPICNAQFN